jgi:deoxyribodipyrimidine photo-lyase
VTAAAHRRAALLFRRDLRLDDNTALGAACAAAAEVVPCFVFDPRQARGAHPYFGEPAFQLLIESLEDLDQQLAAAGGRLYRFEGEPHRVVARLIEEAGVDAVYVNRDYTPFSRRRDAAVERVCAEHRVPFEPRDDLLLAPPGAVVTGAGTPYRTFTPFWRQARTRPVPRPGRFGAGDRLFRGRIGFAEPKTIYRRLLPRRRDGLWVEGGRRRGRELLGRVGRLERYEETRDLPADDDGTSSLSAHHKLGSVSIRESWHAIAAALGEGSELLRQLWWRDFFTQLAWSWPRLRRAVRPPAGRGRVGRRPRPLRRLVRRADRLPAGRRRDAPARRHRLDAQPGADGRRVVFDQGPPPRLAARRALVRHPAGRLRPGGQ